MRYPLAICLLTAPAVAPAQVQGEPIIISGSCDSKSGVSINGGENARFACDTAVVARSDRGTVIIQFTDKSGDDGRILGFAGTVEGKQGFGADAVQIVGVERLYLAGGAKSVPVTRGTCFMNWTGLQRTGGKLTSVTCGAGGQAAGTDVQAVAALTTK